MAISQIVFAGDLAKSLRHRVLRSGDFRFQSVDVARHAGRIRLRLKQAGSRTGFAPARDRFDCLGAASGSSWAAGVAVDANFYLQMV